MLGFSILIPLMPYFVKHFGASDIVVGLLFASFAAAQFIAGPIWGNVSDRMGRKLVLIVSQIGATIGWTMLAFSPTIAWVFVARVVEGFSGGNLSVTQAYVADLVKPEERGRAFSYIGAAFSGGLIFGPAFGGLLFDRFGFTAPFLAAAALQLVTLVVTIFLLPESRSKEEGEEHANASQIVASLTDPNVAPVLWQKLVYSLGLYGWFSIFALVIAAQLHFGAGNTSRLFSAFGLASVVFQIFVTGRMIEKIGNRPASNIGFVSLICTFGAVAFMHDIWMAVFVIVAFSFGMALVNATIPALLTETAPENQRGTILGAGSSLESLSGVVMPPLSTSVLGSMGVPWAAGLSGILTVAALGLGLAASARTAPKAEQPAAASAE